MCPNKQIRHDSEACRTGLTTELAPEFSCLRGCVLGNRLKSDAEEVQVFCKRSIALEMCANLGPDDLARDECTGVVRSS